MDIWRQDQANAILDLFIFLLPFFQRFFCGGRLVFGPDVASLFLTTLLIAGPAIAFCVKIYINIKDAKNPGEAYWCPVLTTCLILTILVSSYYICL